MQSTMSKLKSTHVSVGVPPLPPGWTEHKAPTGHSYYYNAETQQSTYKRPIPEPQPIPAAPLPVSLPYISAQFGLNNALTQFSPTPYLPNQGFTNYAQRGRHHGGRGGFRGGHNQNNDRRKRPEDRPRKRYSLPDCASWVLVETKLGRRFVHNVETKESFWRFPPDVMKAVVEFDRLRREDKVVERDRKPDEEEKVGIGNGEKALVDKEEVRGPDGSSDEYEEVEVTDDGEEAEGNGEGDLETGEKAEDKPVEFNEDDIAYQLAALGEAHGLDPGEYGMEEDWEEGAEGLPLTDEDSRALFYDLLDNHHISPFGTWESVITNDYVTSDERYVALPTTKARKDIWEEWCKDRAAKLKLKRETAERADPRIQYMAFLAANARPSLYWPEFRRKYRKEPFMRDSKISDKEREKLYRDLVSRMKLPGATRKSDLSELMKSLPLSQLNRDTSTAALPSKLLIDVRFAALPASTRDPLVETYISTLPPVPASDDANEEEEEGRMKARQERQRREEALKERERRVQAEKQRAKRQEMMAKGMLLEGEMELERAMKVDKGGLKGQLELIEEKRVANE